MTGSSRIRLGRPTVRSFCSCPSGQLATAAVGVAPLQAQSKGVATTGETGAWPDRRAATPCPLAAGLAPLLPGAGCLGAIRQHHPGRPEPRRSWRGSRRSTCSVVPRGAAWCPTLPDGYMVATWWLPDGYLVVTWWLPDSFLVVTCWLYGGYMNSDLVIWLHDM